MVSAPKCPRCAAAPEAASHETDAPGAAELTGNNAHGAPSNARMASVTDVNWAAANSSRLPPRRRRLRLGADPS